MRVPTPPEAMMGKAILIKMFYSGKADAYETALSLINVALDGDPDDAE